MRHRTLIILGLTIAGVMIAVAFVLRFRLQPELPEGSSINLPYNISIAVAAASFMAALIGALNDLVELIDRLIVHQRARRTEAFPKEAFTLPGADYAGISVSTRPGSGWMHGGPLTVQGLDRSVRKQFLDSQMLAADFERPVYTLQTGEEGIMHMMLTGTSAGEPVQVSNKVPIRVVSFQAVPEVTDIYWLPLAGPGDYWLMNAEISAQAAQTRGQLAWASLQQNHLRLLKRYGYARGPGTSGSHEWPVEARNAIDAGGSQVPDFFLLTENERISLSIACSFRDPGIYRLRFGVEYVHKHKLAFAWSNPPIEVYVLHDYCCWIPPGPRPPWEESLVGVSLNRIYRLHPRTRSGYNWLPVGGSRNFTAVSSNVVFSPDGMLLAVGTFDGSVGLWDALNGAKHEGFKGNNLSSVSALAFSPVAESLATASEFVELWDYRKAKRLKTIEGNCLGVNSLAFSPDGSVLATGGDAVRLWEYGTQSELRTLAEEEGWIVSVRFSPDGKWLASASMDNGVILWNREGYREAGRLRDAQMLNDLAFSPNGRTLAAACESGLLLWTPRTNEIQRLTTDQDRNMRSQAVAFSPDGCTIAAGIEDTIVVWDAITFEKIRTLEFSSQSIDSIAFSPVGDKLAFVAGGAITVIETTGWETVTRISVRQV